MPEILSFHCIVIICLICRCHGCGAHCYVFIVPFTPHPAFQITSFDEMFSLSRKYPSRYFSHFGYAYFFFIIMLSRFSDQHARISIIQNEIDMRHGQTKTKMHVYYRNIKRTSILNFPVAREVFQPRELYFCIIKIMQITLRVIQLAPMNMKYK